MVCAQTIPQRRSGGLEVSTVKANERPSTPVFSNFNRENLAAMAIQLILQQYS